MTTSIDKLRADGELGPLDVQFARAMGRLADEHRAEVLLAAALASHHVSQGDVCLDLSSLCDAETETDRWPDPSTWLDSLRTSPLVSDGSTATPLVLDDQGRLYLRRYWQHEQRLVDTIRARASEIVAGVNTRLLEKGLERLFASPADGEPDLQRAAARIAVERRLSVISGGPGTGKTYTVVKILALLVEQALAAGAPAPRMTLMAPTGKAAARLTESIRDAKTSLKCEDEVKAAITEDATTIHRALGSILGTSTRFHHDQRSPLVTDIVLVDEASMVNVALMARLVAAVPHHARLILLGDRDQLASVEAGAVLGDICNTGGGSQRPAAAAPGQTGIWDCVIHLKKSYRYQTGSGIEALALAINAGDGKRALDVLRSSADDVSLVAPGPPGQLGAALEDAVLTGYAGYLAELPPAEKLARFNAFRVLCGHRVGIRGVVTMNQLIRVALRRHGLLPGRGDLYPGRPVMVTVNNYELRLFNGDVGLVLPNPAGDGVRAYFPATDGGHRLFAPSRLPAHETVFAMSVHKSQGSEFDHVAVVLPDQPSPVVTRELLYTAVTRARKSVVIHARPDVVLDTIRRRIVRASGLRSALWG